jgi:hypothetical protein
MYGTQGEVVDGQIVADRRTAQTHQALHPQKCYHNGILPPLSVEQEAATMRTREQKRLNLSGFGSRYQEVLIPSSDSFIALSIYEVSREAPCVVFLPGTMAHKPLPPPTMTLYRLKSVFLCDYSGRGLDFSE